MSEITENLERVRGRIRLACEACGRDPAAVELVAVSKKMEADRIREAWQAGQGVFGENRVQEALQKQAELPSALRWHLIGHLQTNKVKEAVHARFDCIHSVDSQRLLELLDRELEEQGGRQAILLQVNVSGEASKFGVHPAELPALLDRAAVCGRLEVRGLMTLPPFHPEPEQTATHFAALRDLRDCMARVSGFALPELSMGMSHDLEVAVREGATLVRVGTDIFGDRRN
jgi:pyridoxal phosphate enzyme (YggS family)